MKRWIPLVLAGAAVAFVLFRPAPPPTAGANGWSVTGEPSAGRARRTPAPRAMVYVAGEVMRPGVYPVAAEARVRDALALAGGARPNADLLAVNLAAHVRDGDEIAVPARGAEPAPAAHRSAHGHAGGRRAGGHGSRAGHGKHRRPRRDQAPPVAEVDINTADAEALAAIPGIGEGLALRIVEFRRQNGPFASVDELLDVAGITEHRLDAMIPYVVAR